MDTDGPSHLPELAPHVAACHDTVLDLEHRAARLVYGPVTPADLAPHAAELEQAGRLVTAVDRALHGDRADPPCGLAARDARPRDEPALIELVVDVDPDGGVEVQTFVAGAEITGRVRVVTVDPGRGHTDDDWAENRARAVASLSPAAARATSILYGIDTSDEHTQQGQPVPARGHADGDAGAEHGSGHAARACSVYTVIGVRDATRGGVLTVAAVLPGAVDPVDTEGGPEHASRYADTFTAQSPEHAEAAARAWCAQND